MARGRKFFSRRGMTVFRSCVGFDQASSYVQWLVIRENSSFLRKRKLGTFTTVGGMKLLVHRLILIV